MELNEREKNIVNLINQLSEVASDEATTQDAVDRIIGQIRQTTNENMKSEMKKVESPIDRPQMKIPDTNMTQSLKDAIDLEHERMLEELAKHNHNEHELTSTQNVGELIFTRIREVKAPTRAHPTDAGIDFFVPDAKAWDDDFKDTVKKYSKNKEEIGLDGETFDGLKFDGNVLEVSPNAHVAIPSGIKTIIPQGLAMMMVNKSGVATKLKLDHSACLIDSEYRDELIFCFFNHNVEPVKIEPGMKITQGLIVPVINLQLQEVFNRVYEDMGRETDRGGGFGSSGSH